MRDRKNLQKRLIAAILLGMFLTAVFTGAGREAGAGIPGFFGMLYPQYCFSQIPEDLDGGIPVERKLTFRWLRGL